MKSIKTMVRVVLLAALLHFIVQVAILWFAPWDYTPGQPEELWFIAQRWNWVGAVVSFPLITFSVYFPFEFLEQFIGNFTPVSWIAFCLIDSLLWGVTISFVVAWIARRRRRARIAQQQNPELSSAAVAPDEA